MEKLRYFFQLWSYLWLFSEDIIFRLESPICYETAKDDLKREIRDPRNQEEMKSSKNKFENALWVSKSDLASPDKCQARATRLRGYKGNTMHEAPAIAGCWGG